VTHVTDAPVSFGHTGPMNLHNITNEAEGTQVQIFETANAQHPFGVRMVDLDSGGIISQGVTRCATMDKALAVARKWAHGDGSPVSVPV